MKKLYLVVNVILLFSISSNAQVLEGFVDDAYSGKSLDSVRVKIYNSLSVVALLYTEFDGFYSVNQLPEGKFTLAFSKEGYVDKVSYFEITSRTNEVIYNEELHLIERPNIFGSQLINRNDISSTIIELDNDFSAPFNDPIRMLAYEEGRVQPNDKTGAFSYRGLPQYLNKWYLNGMEIFNQGHLTNVGGLYQVFNTEGGFATTFPHIKGLAASNTFNTKGFSAIGNSINFETEKFKNQIYIGNQGLGFQFTDSNHSVAMNIMTLGLYAFDKNTDNLNYGYVSNFHYKYDKKRAGKDFSIDIKMDTDAVDKDYSSGILVADGNKFETFGYNFVAALSYRKRKSKIDYVYNTLNNETIGHLPSFRFENLRGNNLFSLRYQYLINNENNYGFIYKYKKFKNIGAFKSFDFENNYSNKIFQAFLRYKYHFTNGIYLTYRLEPTYFFNGKQFSPDFKFQFGKQNKVYSNNFSISHTSQLSNGFFEYNIPVRSINLELHFTRRIGRSEFTLTPFFHYLYNVPTTKNNNSLFNWFYNPTRTEVKTNGFSLGYRYESKNKLTFTTNISMFKSQEKLIEDVWVKTDLSALLVANARCEKEFKLNNEKSMYAWLGVQARIGQRQYLYNNLEEYIGIFYYDKTTFIVANYYRIDLGLTYKVRKGKLSLSIQNLTDKKNMAVNIYDVITDTFEPTYHARMVPFITYTLDFPRIN